MPSTPFLVRSQADNARIVTGPGEAGLTLNFGLAKRVFAKFAF
jgi:hypothetical protein